MVKKEVWEDVPNYEGYYQASSLGRIRSLDRWITFKNGSKRFYKGVVIEGSVNKDGYKRTSLNKNGVAMSLTFSQLVAITFLGHKPKGNKLVIDHINGDKLDDRLDNLRIVTHRENTTTCFISKKDSHGSPFTGIYYYDKNNKWIARIIHEGIRVSLGGFTDELEASKAYQLALSKIKDGSFNPDDYRARFSSKYKGVSFCNTIKKWIARIIISGKSKHLGIFPTELEAHHAVQKSL